MYTENNSAHTWNNRCSRVSIYSISAEIEWMLVIRVIKWNYWRKNTKVYTVSQFIFTCRCSINSLTFIVHFFSIHWKGASFLGLTHIHHTHTRTHPNLGKTPETPMSTTDSSMCSCFHLVPREFDFWNFSNVSLLSNARKQALVRERDERLTHKEKTLFFVVSVNVVRVQVGNINSVTIQQSYSVFLSLSPPPPCLLAISQPRKASANFVSRFTHLRIQI